MDSEFTPIWSVVVASVGVEHGVGYEGINFMELTFIWDY